MKIRRIIIVVVAAVCLTLSLFVAACEDDSKYEVSIKVVNTAGDEFIFTPDVDVINQTFEYNSEDVWYYVDSYNMPDHPKYGDVWLEPMQQGYDYILMYGVYTAPDGSTADITDRRCTNEKGRYAFNVYIPNSSVSWYGRNVCLYITIE